MRCTIIDDHACAKDFVTNQRTALARRIKALFTSKEKLFGNAAADDLLFELVAVQGACWLHPASHAGVVPRSARLFLEQMVELDTLGDRFAIGDLWLTGLTFNFVLSSHPFDINFQMKFAHAGDDGLFTLDIEVDSECRVFALEARYGFGKVRGILVVFRLD